MKKTKADLEAENEALREQNERLRERVMDLETHDLEQEAALDKYREMFKRGLRQEMDE